ncbi:MAG: hypothetical protein AAB496_00450 [Patescibacteria group bacterium]
MSILISFAAIFFIIIAVAVILSLLPLPKWKQKKEKEDGNKPGTLTSPPLPSKIKISEMIKISAAGAIFLALLYALVPEFIVKYHKEVIILVVAMVAGAMLLGVKQEWERSPARKILKAHFVILSIVLISIIIYKEFGIGKWIEGGQSASARTAERIVILNLRPGEEMKYSVPPRHLFRIHSDDRVEAKTWDGRIYRDKDTTWLGDEIRHANFVLRSTEETKTARVVITLRPK